MLHTLFHSFINDMTMIVKSQCVDACTTEEVKLVKKTHLELYYLIKVPILLSQARVPVQQPKNPFVFIHA